MFCVHKSAFGASPGQQDYIVSINSSHAGDATKIKDIRFLAIKADAADKYAAVDASSQGTAGAGYATKTTLTFTPASTGDYLLIGSAVLTSEGASSTGARLNHSGGSIYGENLIYPKAAWLYNTWATAAKINLAASSQTFTLQFSPSASVACDIEQARILALRLDKFDNAYVAQDFAGGNSTSASDQDYLTLTQTPLNLSHAILAVGAFRTASTTVSGYLNVCKSGTNYTETIREGVNTAGYVHAGAAVKETLAAGSTTWKWRARAETSGTAIHVDDLLIAVLQLDASPTTVTASVSFDAAIQAARSVAASADAAVQKTISVQAVADAAVQKMLSGQTTVDAARAEGAPGAAFRRCGAYRRRWPPALRPTRLCRWPGNWPSCSTRRWRRYDRRSRRSTPWSARRSPPGSAPTLSCNGRSSPRRRSMPSHRRCGRRRWGSTRRCRRARR